LRGEECRNLGFKFVFFGEDCVDVVDVVVDVVEEVLVLVVVLVELVIVENKGGVTFGIIDDADFERERAANIFLESGEADDDAVDFGIVFFLESGEADEPDPLIKNEVLDNKVLFLESGEAEEDAVNFDKVLFLESGEAEDEEEEEALNEAEVDTKVLFLESGEEAKEEIVFDFVVAVVVVEFDFSFGIINETEDSLFFKKDKEISLVLNLRLDPVVLAFRVGVLVEIGDFGDFVDNVLK